MTKKLLRLAVCIIVCFAFSVANTVFAQDCNYRVVMHKNSAPTGIHGWEGARIMFMGDDSMVFATCALADDLDEDEVIVSLPHQHVNCYWMSGANDYWISFEIYDYNDVILIEAWPQGFEQSLFLDFTPDCNENVPGICENFTATGSENALESYLSWTNPTSDAGGSPTTLTSIVILRDGEEIHTIETTETGTAMIWTDGSVTLPGEHTYSIYAVNESGHGAMNSDIDTVGIYRVLPVSGSESIETCVGFIRSEGDYLGLYPSYYDGSIVIRPATNGEYVHIEGIHYIYDGAMGGEPDHLYVYDGEGMTGEIIADYTGSCFDKGSDDKGTLDATSYTGALTLYFKANGAGGCRGFEIYTSCSPTAGVNENTDNQEFKIYPNPTDDVICIEGENIGTVKIYNMVGQNVGTYENVNKIDVSNYESGLYLIKTNKISRKIVIE